MEILSIDNTYILVDVKWYVFMDSLQRFNDTISACSVPDRTERPKLSCTHDTRSVLEHASAVIAVYIGSRSTYSTDSRLQEIYASLVITLASVGDTVLHSLCENITGNFSLNQMLASFKCNVGWFTRRLRKY